MMGVVLGVADVVGLVAGAVALAMAIVVAKAAPLPSNRALVGILVAEAASHVGLVVASALAANQAVAFAGDVMNGFGLLTLPWLYLLFVRHLATPLVSPLRSRAAAFLLWTAFGATVAVLAAGAFLSFPGPGGPDWLGVVFVANVVALAAASVWALAAAVSTMRRAAPGSLARSRAKAYAVAFGARDALIVLTVATFFVRESGGLPGWAHETPVLVFEASTLVYVPALAYGLLRGEVLDFRERLRRSVKIGTVAAFFIAAYVASSFVVAEMLSTRLGLLAGAVAALLLLPLLAPLRRFADAVASTAVSRAAFGRSDEEARREILRLAMDELGSAARANPAAAAHLRELHALAEMPAVWQPGGLVRGRFRLLQELGQGGGGRTYLAEDTQLHRRVALKRLQGAETDQLLREARALASVSHPNVATLFDAWVENGAAVLVMEYVDGGSLRDRLERGPLPPAEWGRVAAQVLGALEAVHAVGVVHRDVKPSNVLLTRDGDVKMADFGIALTFEEETRTRDHGAVRAAGSPRYMSPEQARGLPATERSDVYSAALTLLEAWTGAPHVPPTSQGPLWDWFRRALDARPERRFESARECRHALEEILAAGVPAPQDV